MSILSDDGWQFCGRSPNSVVADTPATPLIGEDCCTWSDEFLDDRNQGLCRTVIHEFDVAQFSVGVI